jgi:hypothetical protein
LGKILGVREQQHGLYPLRWLERQQQTSLLGSNYEAVGAVEQAHSPYDGLGAAAKAPFDLNDPEAVAEIKRALVALAERDADPFQGPSDLITETVWKEVDPTSPAWDGQTADEFVAAISRYAPNTGVFGPYMQLGGSKYGEHGIVGGPQPTANGLEIIAGAVETKLNGTPRMSKYLAWRGGMFNPPSMVSKPPPGSVVIPTGDGGRFWDPASYTPTWPDGDPEAVASAAAADAALIECWRGLEKAKSEAARMSWLLACARMGRAVHHAHTLRANVGAPDPKCPPQMKYNRTQGTCTRLPGIIDLPPTEITLESCVSAYMELEGKSEEEARRLCGADARAGAGAVPALALGAAVGLGIWWWQKSHTTTRRKR